MNAAVPDPPQRLSETCPLVVDLDGTLVPTDTLVESALGACRRNPLNVFRMLAWAWQGPATLKEKLGAIAPPDAALLPYREDLIEHLRAQHAQGREIVLATAAHQSIADAVARHLGFFSQVFGTQNGVNLKGAAKLARLRQAGITRFVYAGDSAADLPIWQEAHAAIPVGVGTGLMRRVQQLTPVEATFAAHGPRLRDWRQALRLHQWLKNLLLFVPLLTAFAFDDARKLEAAVTGFFALSLCASASYVFNDLWDLRSDRLHPRKRLRPFASGRIPIAQGVVCAMALLLAGFALAARVSSAFCGVVGLYLVLTVSYSWHFKSRMVLDVVALSMLYTLRIVAGSVACDIVISRWLLAFAGFSFLGLALVKRCAELIHKRHDPQDEWLPGRGYKARDMEVLYPFGIGASLASIVVFCLFASAPETAMHYGSTHLLWFAAIGFVYLYMRLWLKTVRGEMHDDPLVHMLENRGSLAAAALIVLTVMAAHLGGSAEP